MGKCADCKRPKVVWVKKVRRLADELMCVANSSDSRLEQGRAEGYIDAGKRLDELLKEIEQ